MTKEEKEFQNQLKKSGTKKQVKRYYSQKRSEFYSASLGTRVFDDKRRKEKYKKDLRFDEV